MTGPLPMTPPGSRRVWLLLAAAVAIVVMPLVLPGLGGEFKGTDDQASDLIAEARPGYQPWARPLWQPPSGEVESLLFAVQAALGAGVFGYVLGRRHAGRTPDQPQPDAGRGAAGGSDAGH